MKERIDLPLDFEKDVEISKYQMVEFGTDTELYGLYLALVKRWNLDVGMFAASMFYNIGRIHGIREERTRRKGKKHKRVPERNCDSAPSEETVYKEKIKQLVEVMDKGDLRRLWLIGVTMANCKE